MDDNSKRKNSLVEMVKALAPNMEPETDSQVALQEELQRSAERFKTIFTYCTDPVFIIDPRQQTIIDVNDRACSITGYSHPEMASMRFSKICPRQSRQFKRFAKMILELGSGWTEQFTCRTSDGDFFPAELTAWPIEIEKNICLLAFVRDVSTEKRTEKALWESEQKFSTLIENMQEGVMIVDNDDVIQFVNDRMCELLGYEVHELLGKIGYRILFNKKYQKTIRQKNRLRTRNVADKYEIEMRRKDGSDIWVSISGVPITDSNNRVTGSFGIITDVTDRKQAVEALRKAHDDLERRVEERTAELLQSNKSLQMEVQERKQIEEERQKFISLVENSGDLITMADPDGRLIYLNKAGMRILGIQSASDIQSRYQYEFHPEEVRSFVKDELFEKIIAEGAWRGELPIHSLETGVVVPTLFNGFAVRHPVTNDLLAITAICRDITDIKRTEEALRISKDELEIRVQERTAELSEANQILMQQIIERQRAEEQLQQNENRYRLLFNSGNDGVFVYHPLGDDNESAFVEVNDVACEQLGYTREELLRLSPRSIVLGYDQKVVSRRLNKLSAEKHVLYEDMFLTKTGDKIPVEISAHVFDFDEKPAVMSIARDITARKRAEGQIREQAALLDKAQDAILVCDLNDYVVYWNKSAERLYGWTMEEAIGNNAFELLFKRKSMQFINSRRAVLENEEWQGELQQVTKEGREIIVESRWTLVHDNHGEAKSILLVNTDVTEKKKIEAQFLRAQRMESIGALAGGIAHDLNNVLAPILTAVQILEVRYTDEKSQKILNTVESNVKRGADMVKQILTFARGVEGERIPIKLQHLINELETITLETFPKSISIRIDLRPNLWMVSGDATQLHQVLLNLCVNARDAMNDGGTLTLMVENVTLDAAFTRTNIEARVGDYLKIRVSDTGAGIPANIIDKIFEPFFTTKEHGKGTGLGLSTVIAIVQSHGGFVNVESELGLGTTFEIYLPAQGEQDGESSDMIETDLPYGSGEVIMLVDDETSILEITRETLETYGYDVITAADGAEAVGIYAQHKEAIELVITDMMMPVMDGPATIRALRKINPEIKIVASSGFLEDAQIVEFIGQGVNAFLHKPYTAEKVLEVLHRLIKGKVDEDQDEGDTGEPQQMDPPPDA